MGWSSVNLLRLFYATSFCQLATYHRYLVLYFEEDGLDATDIGTLLAGARFVTTLFQPLWGALADKTKKARTMQQVSLVAATLPMLSLLLPVPSSGKLWARCAGFWVFSIVNGPTMSLRDALAMAAVDHDPEAWGKARAWGAASWGVMHLCLGPLIDYSGARLLFVVFFAMSFLFVIVLSGTVPEACGKVRKEVTVSAIYNIFHCHRLFFLNMVAIGAGFSFVEGLLFVYLEDLRGSSTLLCGISVVVTVVFELPIFHWAKQILAALGYKKMVLLGQVAWVVRAAFYALMGEAWMVLIIEPLHGVTFALVWTAATHYVANPAVCGEGLEASAQTLLQACFMGLGPMIGLSLGGYLFDAVGPRRTYSVFAVTVLACGCIYALFTEEDASTVPGMKSLPSSADVIGCTSEELGEVTGEEASMEVEVWGSPRQRKDNVVNDAQQIAHSADDKLPDGGLMHHRTQSPR